jgi:pyruvate dehydrogenase E2 component (dihydrolipoamide acetyltransferase)
MSATTEFRLPRLADSVTSVRLSLWLKQEGDRVEAGEPIVEVETDKTNVELDAPVAGVLRAIRVAAGVEGLEAGTLLALIADVPAGEAATSASPPTASEPGRVVDIAPAVPIAVAAPVPDAPPPVEAAPLAAAQVSDDIAATPMGRRMAAVAGVALVDIPGTGRDGQITKADVERVLTERTGASVASGVPASPAWVEDGVGVPSAGPFHDEDLSAIRRVTATRMQHAKRTVPHFYLRIECAADAALALLASAKQVRPDLSPTVTDLVIRAAALALRKVPRANSAWIDGRVRLYEDADIAVAVNTPNGLITPIVRGADKKDLAAVATETRGLVARAREGRLRPEEYAGGTFTISNLGMYGVESLYAIVNPPQSCILGVGAAVSRPVVAGNEIRVGQVMVCTLSADHRAIDGAVGAELLAAIRDHIEQPGLMLV